MSKLRQAALKYAARGLRVLPIKPRQKFPPLIKAWEKEACTHAPRIEAWWEQWPDANIGIACGKQSGIFVLDIDMDEDKDGESSLREIEARHGSRLPATVEQITGRGGRQLIFAWPGFDGAPVIRNSASQIGPDIDIRGEGGYFVAPPSVHPNGREYRWSVDTEMKPVEAPVWFLHLLNASSVAELDTRRDPEHWQRIAGGVSEGARNQSAASLAGYLLRKGVDAQTTLDLLLGWNQRCSPPQSPQVIKRTVESVLAKEIKRRGRC
jgi:hypothetical protein